MMSIRTVDDVVWQRAFVDRSTIAQQNIVVSHALLNGVHHSSTTHIAINDSLCELLPQLRLFQTVFPHVIQCDGRYVLCGFDTSTPARRQFVCAAVGDAMDAKKFVNHMSLKQAHGRVHKYTACTHTQVSTCEFCGTCYTNERLLIGHWKKQPTHRTRPVLTARPVPAQVSVELMINAAESTPVSQDMMIRHTGPKHTYTPAVVDRTALNTFVVPLIRVHGLTIQCYINNVLYHYVPGQCRKIIFDKLHVVSDPCSITLSGKVHHKVWSNPLPYYVLVQYYYCSTHQDRFNCLRHTLPPNALINPDVIAVGSSDITTNAKVTLIDRTWYCTVITQYVVHFNATSVHNNLLAQQQQAWLSLTQQHARILNSCGSYYTDPGIDPQQPYHYYTFPCGEVGDSPERIMQCRQGIRDKFRKLCCSAVSADFIDKLFHCHYIPYELTNYLKASNTMVHHYGVEFVVADHTFKAVSKVHVYDPSGDHHSNSNHRYTSRPLVKCQLSTIMCLQTSLIVSACIVPSTECYHVENQISSYLQAQALLPFLDRTTLHSIGVDNAVSVARSLLESTYVSIIKYKIVPEHVTQSWAQQQSTDAQKPYVQRMHIIEFFDLPQNEQYRCFCTEDIWHLKQRILDKGSLTKHPSFRAWNVYVDGIFEGITSMKYKTAMDLKRSLQQLLYVGSNAIIKQNDRSLYGVPDSTDVPSMDTCNLLINNITLISQHRISSNNQYEYYVSSSDNTAQWFTYEKLYCCGDKVIRVLNKYLSSLNNNRPYLNSSGCASLKLMISNVQYIFNIVLLKQLYPHLKHNSGTNQLEARHSVLNSMKPKKGTNKFQHVRHQVDVHTVLHNLRRLLKLASVSIDNNDIKQAARVRRLRHQILSAFKCVLPELTDESEWFDTTFTDSLSPTWLPVFGHMHGVLWQQWIMKSCHTDVVHGYKIYRNKRLSDLSACEVVHMVLEYQTYQHGVQNGTELHQDVQQLKHHLASKVFHNKRGVNDCEHFINVLNGISTTHTTIVGSVQHAGMDNNTSAMQHAGMDNNTSAMQTSVSGSVNRDQAVQALLMSCQPALQQMHTDLQADKYFAEMLEHIRGGVTNKKRIQLLFQRMDIFTQLTAQQLRAGIERYSRTDNMVWASQDNETNDDSTQELVQPFDDSDAVVIDETWGDDSTGTAPTTPIRHSVQHTLQH